MAQKTDFRSKNPEKPVFRSFQSNELTTEQSNRWNYRNNSVSVGHFAPRKTRKQNNQKTQITKTQIADNTVLIQREECPTSSSH